MEINDEETDALRASACACPDQDRSPGRAAGRGGPNVDAFVLPPVDCAVHGRTPPNLRICQELMGQAVSLLVPLLCWATPTPRVKKNTAPFTVLPPVLRRDSERYLGLLYLTKLCSASNEHILPHEITRGRHMHRLLPTG